MKSKTKKVAFLSCCTALALILSYVETILPPLLHAVPGIKIGLPNIVILFLLYRLGMRDAVVVSLIRIIISSTLFGNPMMFIYSASGAFLSLVGMAVLKKTDILSAVGVSAAGGVLHNIGQILAAIFLLATAELGYYLIILSITGTISGILIGICSGILIKRVPDIKM